MSYGLPYKGSKSTIVKDLVANLPSGERLVDLFCGGCAVTDFAMKKTDKYRKFLVNDLEGMLRQGNRLVDSRTAETMVTAIARKDNELVIASAI